MNLEIKVHQSRNRHADSNILGEGIIHWPSIGVELRVSIVKGMDGNTIVRWPRRKLTDGRQVFTGRMRTMAATNQIEKAVLAKWTEESKSFGNRSY